MTTFHLEAIGDTGFLGGAQCTCGHPIRFAHYLTNGSERIVVGACCMRDYLSSENPQTAKALRLALRGMYRDCGASNGAQNVLDRYKNNHVWSVVSIESFKVVQGKRVSAKFRDLLVEYGTAWKTFSEIRKPYLDHMVALVHAGQYSTPAEPDSAYRRVETNMHEAGKHMWVVIKTLELELLASVK